MTDLFSISNKVAVITGGSGVLGSSIAHSFLEAGAYVIILGRTREKIDQMVAGFSKISDRISGYTCDVMDRDKLQQIATQIANDHGRLDILLNVAGGNTKGGTVQADQNVFDLELPALDETIAINLQGTIYPSLIFGKLMAAAGSGCIINISSMASISALTRVPGYSVAKSGVDIFTKWMATELALKFGDKLRVNAVAPGFFIGEQNRRLLLNEDGSFTERAQKIINKTPMGRFGEITELNGAIQFLCSDAASFVTGIVLPIDGGFSAFSGV